MQVPLMGGTLEGRIQVLHFIVRTRLPLSWLKWSRDLCGGIFRHISFQIWTCFPLMIHQHWCFTGAMLSFFACFVQISGRKELFLYEPHQNSRLYEAHIQEASLAFNPVTKKFWRKELLESTSMVMSPVDILNPDYNRFPKFKEAQALNCTINEGDVLFMPSFWWHEVQSYPSEHEPRNLAVNFWWVFFLLHGVVFFFFYIFGLAFCCPLKSTA